MVDQPVTEAEVPSSKKIRIYFAYRHIDKPWGGANTFIRALNQSLHNSGDFQLTTSFDEPCDLLFMNQLGAGPGSEFKEWRLQTIRQRVGDSCSDDKEKRRPALAVRAVNLSLNVDTDAGIRTRLLGYLRDRKIVALLNIADLVIFQSNYQKQVFVDAGYRGQRSVIIYNGVDNDFWEETPKYQNNSDILKVIATSFSIRSIKRHDLIARFSMLPKVTVTYIGNWPGDIQPCKVNLRGVLNRSQIKDLMREHHYFLHPATRDACPNSILEALSAGLPVIFNPQPGSSAELVREAGIALDEDDLIATVSLARSELNLRRARALQQREQFRLGIVARQYADAFRDIIQMDGE